MGCWFHGCYKSTSEQFYFEFLGRLIQILYVYWFIVESEVLRKFINVIREFHSSGWDFTRPGEAVRVMVSLVSDVVQNAKSPMSIANFQSENNLREPPKAIIGSEAEMSNGGESDRRRY